MNKMYECSSEKQTGRVIKNYNGYYYVDLSEPTLRECRRRGKVKHKILVGDEVEVMATDHGKGLIEAVLPRQNELRRPAVANIDQIVMVLAAQSPDPDYFLTDKLLLTCAYHHISPLLCMNKSELQREVAQAYCQHYTQCGYKTLAVSAHTGEGIDLLRSYLPGKITAFSGPSGVGKSSLLTLLLGKELATGAVSEKIRRGRHTTRHAEMLCMDAHTYVVDTPGFAAIELEPLKVAKLALLFPEFKPYVGQCRFPSCVHVHEPDCAIKEAKERGEISETRYMTYCKLLHEIKERKSFV